MDIFEFLEKLDIKYEMIEHEPLFTIEDAKKIKNMIDGVGCKNLFLTDKKGKFFLYVLHEDKKADLNALRKFLDVSKLTFGSENDLMKILNLKKGSVTPLGILNDKDNKVILLIDQVLVGRKLLMHPNVNTKTIAVMYNDLLKIIENCKHKMIVVNI